MPLSLSSSSLLVKCSPIIDIYVCIVIRLNSHLTAPVVDYCAHLNDQQEKHCHCWWLSGQISAARTGKPIGGESCGINSAKWQTVPLQRERGSFMLSPSANIDSVFAQLVPPLSSTMSICVCQRHVKLPLATEPTEGQKYFFHLAPHTNCAI